MITQSNINLLNRERDEAQMAYKTKRVISILSHHYKQQTPINCYRNKNKK
jgi:hypothetical protein